MLTSISVMEEDITTGARRSHSVSEWATVWVTAGGILITGIHLTGGITIHTLTGVIHTGTEVITHIGREAITIHITVQGKAR